MSESGERREEGGGREEGKKGRRGAGGGRKGGRWRERMMDMAHRGTCSLVGIIIDEEDIVSCLNAQYNARQLAESRITTDMVGSS